MPPLTLSPAASPLASPRSSTSSEQQQLIQLQLAAGVSRAEEEEEGDEEEDDDEDDEEEDKDEEEEEEEEENPAPVAGLPGLPAATFPPPSLPPTALSESSALAAVRALPVLRLLEFRAGRSFSNSRIQNYEAAVGTVVGSVASSPCSHCAAGSGCFARCVTVANRFGGSCTNCHYNSEGSRCSLRCKSNPFLSFTKLTVTNSCRCPSCPPNSGGWCWFCCVRYRSCCCPFR